MSRIRYGLAALAITLAAAPAALAQSGAVMAACKGDIEKLCSDVQPSGGRIGECLKAHRDQVSTSCKVTLAKEAAARRQGGANGGAAPKEP